MATCCRTRCNCAIVAGDNITVTGTGSASLMTPYVISAGPPITPIVTVTDTPSMDLTVTGAGTVVSPYVVSGVVILDPVPPAGGTNLLHSGPDGLYVECSDVRSCLSAGDGIAYSPATGVITAHLSGVAGNVTTIAADGGLYTPAAAALVLQAGDTTTVDNTLSGAGTLVSPYVLTSAVIVDPVPPAGGTNLLHAGADGLYVECADVRGCISAGDGVTYNPATGVVSAHLSTTAGNTVVIGGDGGLLVPTPAATPLTVTDSTSVDLTLTGAGTLVSPYNLTAAAILDATPPGGGTNLLHVNAGGLYTECADVRGCISAGDGATYDPATGIVTAHVSTDAGNTTAIGTDGGLYTPAAAGTATVIQAGDTTTVDNTLSGAGTLVSPYVLTSAVIVDPVPPAGGTNLLHAGADGLYVECADVRDCISAGDGVTYNPATGVVSAHLSTTAGNTVVIGGDGGLLVPTPAATPLTVTDSTSVDLTLTGAGTLVSPYNLTAAAILDATPPGGGTNLLHVNAGGLYTECSDVRGCISAGDGVTYDPATGVITAHVSTVAGNATVIAADGGLYTPTGGGTATVLQAGDTTTVDNTVSGAGTLVSPYVVSSAVIVDPVPPAGGTNLLHAGADGLYVECADVRGCISAGDGVTYNPATGVVSAHLSTTAGNTVVIGGDGGLLVPTPAATPLTVTDSTSVDLTLTGAGTLVSPYNLTAAAILDATPPGGGTNLLHVNAGGLYTECADVRGCISAGNGAAYTAATGVVVARLSTDVGNVVTFGTDGGLKVVTTPPVTGCGLDGSGTVADPLIVVPEAGSEAWPWPCTAADHSGVKCDPATGKLWSPPEHYSAEDHIYVEHFNGGIAAPITPTGGWVIIDPTAQQLFDVPPDFIGNECRTWGYVVSATGIWDITYTGTATFELGYIEVKDGGAPLTNPLWGVFTAQGTAQHIKDNGTMHETSWNIPHGTGGSVQIWPAIRVITGSVTIASWITDAVIITTTNTP